MCNDPKPPMPSTAGWLPISTAPKDGTPFLACSGNWRTVGFWHKHRRCWAVSGPAYESYPADEQPTHWQLLPAPSQEGASEGEGRKPATSWKQVVEILNDLLFEDSNKSEQDRAITRLRARVFLADLERDRAEDN